MRMAGKINILNIFAFFWFVGCGCEDLIDVHGLSRYKTQSLDFHGIGRSSASASLLEEFKGNQIKAFQIEGKVKQIGENYLNNKEKCLKSEFFTKFEKIVVLDGNKDVKKLQKSFTVEDLGEKVKSRESRMSPRPELESLDFSSAQFPEEPQSYLPPPAPSIEGENCEVQTEAQMSECQQNTNRDDFEAMQITEGSSPQGEKVEGKKKKVEEGGILKRLTSPGNIFTFGTCAVVLTICRKFLRGATSMKEDKTPPPQPSPRPTLQRHNSSRKSKKNCKPPSVLERFSSVLNKAKHGATPAPSTATGAPATPSRFGASRVSKKLKVCDEGELRLPQLKHETFDEKIPEEMDTSPSDPPKVQLLDSKGEPSTSRPIRVKPGVLVSNRFQVEKEVGRGGFSKVFLGKDQKTGRKVAIKTGSKLIHNQTESLKKELSIYEELQKCSRLSLSIPNFIHYTEVDIKRMGILVMDLLGPSLEDLFKSCDFSLGTVANVMEQMLDILQFVHGKSFLHRDIKPENILVGRLGTPEAERIFLIDFGTVGTWQSNSAEGKHVSCEYGRAKLGTNSYMSLNAHRGKTQGRRDDLEALGYCMIRFLKKSFPWTRYDDCADEIKEVITAKMKAEMDFQTEFPLDQYPPEIPEYLVYVRELGFEAEPEYETLKGKFSRLAERLKEEGKWEGLEWTREEIVQKFQQH